MSIVYEIKLFRGNKQSAKKPNNDEKDKNNLLRTSIPTLGANNW